MSGNVCKFCGATQQGDHYHLYQCGSWICASGAVVQSNTCQHRCLQMRLQHEQTIEAMRQRIADAVERSQRAMRFVADPIGIECVFARDLDRVIEILQGSYPEIPDGSNNSPENQEGWL